MVNSGTRAVTVEEGSRLTCNCSSKQKFNAFELFAILIQVAPIHFEMEQMQQHSKLLQMAQLRLNCYAADLSLVVIMKE